MNLMEIKLFSDIHLEFGGMEPGEGDVLILAGDIVCVDDIANVLEIAEAVLNHDTEIECLVEIDCGAGRCGVLTTSEVVKIALAIRDAPGLKFSGIQAYQGAIQHLEVYKASH